MDKVFEVRVDNEYRKFMKKKFWYIHQDIVINGYTRYTLSYLWIALKLSFSDLVDAVKTQIKTL